MTITSQILFVDKKTYKTKRICVLYGKTYPVTGKDFDFLCEILYYDRDESCMIFQNSFTRPKYNNDRMNSAYGLEKCDVAFAN